MIALDTSAIVAVALDEDEAESFGRIVATNEALVGAPTLLEAHLVLTTRIPSFARKFLDSFTALESVNVVPFSAEMYRTAAEALDIYGKGRGHLARLNFGDCLAYAVAKHHDIPLLFKGQDFSRTDIRSALS
jgi:ribonuclease VapC